jgi:hypothetical protein
MKDLVVCPRCPNLHARLLASDAPDRTRLLAMGLWHLADHVAAFDRESDA